MDLRSDLNQRAGYSSQATALYGLFAEGITGEAETLHPATFTANHYWEGLVRAKAADAHQRVACTELIASKLPPTGH